MTRELNGQGTGKPGGVFKEHSKALTPRRLFLGKIARKAAWITPAVWTLTANQAKAVGSDSPSAPSCAAGGAPCVVDTDCCSNLCNKGKCKN